MSNTLNFKEPGTRCLFVIPARGGSKGIPGKNIKPLAGKPLMCYSVDIARALASDDDICVTSDDAQIIETVENYGLPVPFVRPDHLASDTASTYDALLHALEFYREQGKEYDVIILLQPTSPLRKLRHVTEAVELYSSDLDMVVGVKKPKSSPYFTLYEEREDGLLERSKPGLYTRRQDCPPVYEYNGAVYVINVRSLEKTHMFSFNRIQKYVMDDTSSMDLDTLSDWRYLEFLVNNGEVSLGME